ncbi:MAG: DUF3704 domain-containing protein [Oscillospiraceae bacterium]|nr:DUF3704 domain-containing protein [Oscillospiraceae bacterium]
MGASFWYMPRQDEIRRAFQKQSPPPIGGGFLVLF